MSVTEDGYGSLFVEQDVNDNYSEVDQAAYHESGNKMTVESKQNNNYSSLEANKWCICVKYDATMLFQKF